MSHQAGFSERKNQMVVEAGELLGDGWSKDVKTTPVYANKLSAREMYSLIAICDTLIPSIDGSEAGHVDEYLAVFYASSASQAGTPHRVAGLISERLIHPKTWLLRVALWALSTWIGSLVLCGRKSFSGDNFPFFQRFQEMPQHQREEIVLSWALSYFSLIRMFFKTLKLLIFLVFFTQVDGKKENVSWKAIGYSGPDSGRKRRHEQDNEKKMRQEDVYGPLYKGIIDIGKPQQSTADCLESLGFAVSVLDDGIRTCQSTISSPSMKIRCDAVVVGSGSGGGVVAGVLAKAGYKVLVLEKGNYYARSNLSLLEGEAVDQMYLSGGLVASSNMDTVILAGATVGGGSTINWSASIRTPKHVVQEWSERYDLELFDSQLYQEALDAVCEKMGVQTEILDEGFNNAVLRRGCEELGFPVHTIPRNSPADHYCGFCCLGCKDGKKKGTAETWLVDLVDSGNGAILPGCEAIKVLHKWRRGKKTATGIAFTHNNPIGTRSKIYVVEANVTIVACGALRTPDLLRRSGLKNPNIGKHLHLHPVAMAWGWFPDGKWPENYKKSYEGGIMTAMSDVVANCENPTPSYSAIIQTPALHPGMFSALMPWISGKDFKDRMVKFSRTAHIFTLARDEGSGTIHCPSCIDYHMDTPDESKLKRGLEKTLRILAAAGAEEIGTHNMEGRKLNVKAASPCEFEEFVTEESSKPVQGLKGQICSAHQMGSCRMGIDPTNSAVRPTGETWEVEGLFVADSSVFPTALGVNPMVTVQAVAYCVGKYVLEILRRKKRVSGSDPLEKK